MFQLNFLIGIWKIMSCPFLYKVKNRLLLIIALAGVLQAEHSFGQSREALIKAGFIEKFTHFVQWPDEAVSNDSSGSFVISVIGENTFGSTLEELFSKVEINNKQVEVEFISSAENIGQSMILFVSGSERRNLNEILNYTSGKPILTISDSEGFGEKGVLINMFTEGDYIRYEVNQRALNKSGLKVSSLLLNYAVIIKSDV